MTSCQNDFITTFSSSTGIANIGANFAWSQNMFKYEAKLHTITSPVRGSSVSSVSE